MNQDDQTAARRRGRPAIGQGIPVYVRFRPEEIERLDAWRSRQEEPVSRACAVRNLVRLALALVEHAPGARRTAALRS